MPWSCMFPRIVHTASRSSWVMVCGVHSVNLRKKQNKMVHTVSESKHESVESESVTYTSVKTVQQ